MANHVTVESKAYGSLSEFYLALWAHIDAFSDESRWFRASATPSMKERIAELSEKFHTLQNMKLDGVLMSSISNEFKTTLRLGQEFMERSDRYRVCVTRSKTGKRPCRIWGLEFARLESVS